MSLPILQHIVEQVDRDNPGLIRDQHAFTALVCSTLHAVDPRFGLNGKRGNPNDTSEDCTAGLDPESPLVGSDGRRIRIIDFVIGAGGPNPRPGWIDQTSETIRLNTTGVWVRPAPLVPSIPDPQPPTPPTVPAPPPPAPCQCKAEPCPVGNDIAALFESFSKVAGSLQVIQADHKALVRWLGEHIDDIKARIDAKPVTQCKSRGWL